MFFEDNFNINHLAHANGKKVTKHIVEADIWSNSSVKNVALILFVNKSQVLTVTEKRTEKRTEEIGFIAGMLNKKKISDNKSILPVWNNSTNSKHNNLNKLRPTKCSDSMGKYYMFSPLENKRCCSKVSLIDRPYQYNISANKVEHQDSKKNFNEIYEYEPEIVGLKREYKEETGHEFNNIRLIKKFVYNGHTAIFIGIATGTIETILGPENDGEIISMQLADINDIKCAIIGTSSLLPYPFRKCALFSTACILAYLGLMDSSMCNPEICDCASDTHKQQSSLR
jgi:hypothetical protein